MQIKNVLSGLWLILLMAGCSFQIISSYDQQTVDQLEMLEKQIDLMYGEAQLLPARQRTFEPFAKTYLSVDVNIRALYRRQLRRESNSETSKQVEILSSLWIEDMQTHKKTDSLSDFIIKRRQSQYQRLFAALIEGEIAKKMD